MQHPASQSTLLCHARRARAVLAALRAFAKLLDRGESAEAAIAAVVRRYGVDASYFKQNADGTGWVRLASSVPGIQGRPLADPQVLGDLNTGGLSARDVAVGAFSGRVLYTLYTTRCCSVDVLGVGFNTLAGAASRC